MENSTVITQELKWLDNLIQTRISNYFNTESKLPTIKSLNLEESYYKNFIEKNNLTLNERKILVLCLAVELAPNLLDIFLTKNKLYDMPFSEFGGITNTTYNSFIPTIQTALFLIAGDDRVEYIDNIQLFNSTNKLYKMTILESSEFNNSINFIHNKLSLSKNTLNLILYGNETDYKFSVNFPATLQTTNYEWEDLVLSQYTMEHLTELDMWLKHSNTLLNNWNMSKSINKGYKALFYGSSGTGKTLTASLLGKRFNKLVYRIDLSKVFKSAEKEDWILFFDEADSLFGKRTQVSSSNDKYANQETAYLLQRVEECTNLVILATNLKDNFDDAFLRRFQSIIYFPIPSENERLRLWEKGFSQKADLQDIDLLKLSSKYELSGANIINIIRLASLMAINKNTNKINKEDVIMGIRREKYKEGKII